MTKIIFIAKTNLNNDGRILNQIKILQNKFKENLNLHFLLLPDKPFKDNLGKGVTIHNLDTSSRRNKFLRPFTVIEFTYKSLKKLSELKPSIIHVQDFAVVLPVYLYKKFINNKVIIIYDDHEMPNENESLQYKFLQLFERKLMKLANIVIYANQERQEILDKELRLNNSSYFLNLPYFDKELSSDLNDIESHYAEHLRQLQNLKSTGSRLIIHQGLLEVERGREKLANFSKLNLLDTKIVIIGISEVDFKVFIDEFNLDIDNFYFVGSVPYNILSKFWEIGNAAIIMYLPTFINNRLCAPNRYFIALKLALPTIVNIDNPVLFNLTEKYSSGFYIENIKTTEDLEDVIKHKYYVNTLEDLKNEEIRKFESIYENYI